MTMGSAATGGKCCSGWGGYRRLCAWRQCRRRRRVMEAPMPQRSAEQGGMEVERPQWRSKRGHYGVGGYKAKSHTPTQNSVHVLNLQCLAQVANLLRHIASIMIWADSSDVNPFVASLVTALNTMLQADSSTSNRLVPSLVAALCTMLSAYSSNSNRLVASLGTSLHTMISAYSSNVNRLVTSLVATLRTMLFAYFSNVN